MGEATSAGPQDPAQPRRRITQGPLLRKLVKILLDALVTCVAFEVSSSVQFQGLSFDKGLLAFVLLAMFINLGFRFHTQHYRAIGIPDARSLVLGTSTLAVTAMVLCYLRDGWSANARPEVVLGASLLTGFLWLAVRLSSLAVHQRQISMELAKGSPAPAERTLIIGAGRAGVLLCQNLREHPRLRCNVLGFVDDDLEKQGLRILGIPVLGATELLPTYIREQRISQVILGMPGIRGAQLRDLNQAVLAEGARLKTVPGIADLIGDRPWKPEVRDVAIEDLLRRDPVTLDTDAIRQALDGETVLITGGGGSIGSEIARRVADFHRGKLVLLGRGENSLWETNRQVQALFPDLEVEIALCDIRNPERLRQAFQKWHPKVIFHAAAHKKGRKR